MLLALSLDVRGDAPSHNVLTDERGAYDRIRMLPMSNSRHLDFSCQIT
jgi:hypothetical protein